MKFPSRYLAVLCVCVFVASCGTAAGKEVPAPRVISIHAGANIQSAVAKANPGDMFLIDAGTYDGPISISTNNVTLRGRDRNAVIIDGDYKTEKGIDVTANGVRVENLTVQKFTKNGVSFSGTSNKKTLDRYSASYLNLLNNGVYGLAATAARDGLISHVYATANAGAGIHVEQCSPCRTGVFNNTTEGNGTGISIDRAGKELFVYQNVVKNNRMGIELINGTEVTQSDTTVIGNVASENANKDAPTLDMKSYGYGITVRGGSSNIIEKNATSSNAQIGILLTSRDDLTPQDNVVRGNVSRSNSSEFGFDLAYFLEGEKTVMSNGNCFEQNDFSSASIDHIENTLPCTGGTPGPFAAEHLHIFRIPDAPSYDSIDVTVQTRKSMPGSLTTRPEPLISITAPELSEVSLPDA